MSAEPSRRLFWGHAAVQSKTSSPAAIGGRALSARARVAIAATLAGSALLVITAATALPSLRHDAAHATAATRRSAPHRAIIAPLAASHELQSDVAAQRFTGRVGANLSDSLSAAGVPGV